MTESEPDESDEEQTAEPLTLDVNGARYALNDEMRKSIQERAMAAFEPNPRFSCWWRRGTQEDEEHDAGDPILVIETHGSMVPWDDLDELEVEMEEPERGGNDYADDGDTQDVDSGSGMATVPKDDVSEDGEDESPDRSHFMWSPQQFEEVPQPEGEEPDEIPPKPEQVSETPDLVYWVPRHPEREERWDTGEALVPCDSWVEWNVQAMADDVRLTADGEQKANSHDHWESICHIHDCEKVGEYQVTQDVPRNKDEEAGSVERKGEDAFEDGRYGGGHWQV